MRVLQDKELALVAGGTWWYDYDPILQTLMQPNGYYYDMGWPPGWSPSALGANGWTDDGYPVVTVHAWPEDFVWMGPDIIIGPDPSVGSGSSPPNDWAFSASDFFSAVASGQAAGMLALSNDFNAHKTIINLPPYVFGAFAVVLTADKAYDGNVQGTYEAAASTLGGMAGAEFASIGLTALRIAGASVAFGPAGIFIGVASAAALGTMAGYMLANEYTMDEIFEDLYKLGV